MTNSADIFVIAPLGATRGTLLFLGDTFDCALGRSGITTTKQEGDGATPAGSFLLREARYRPDRLPAPQTSLPLSPIAPEDGWCDAPGNPAYNRPVRLPYPASAENLWRDDGLYDLVVMLGYNDDPVISGKGSAIFFHLAKSIDDVLQPTEGCVALRLPDMQSVLARLTPATRMIISIRP